MGIGRWHGRPSGRVGAGNCAIEVLGSGRRDGPKPQGEFFWEKNRNQNEASGGLFWGLLGPLLGLLGLIHHRGAWRAEHLAFGFGSFSKRTPPGASARPAGHPERISRTSIRKKILQDGPRWLPRWPRWPKMASKMVQDGLQVRPRWSKTASKTAQESPRRPKIASRWPKTAQEAPKRPPRQPKRPLRGPNASTSPGGLIALRRSRTNP